MAKMRKGYLPRGARIIIGILIPGRSYLGALDRALSAYFQVILGSHRQVIARGAFQARAG